MRSDFSQFMKEYEERKKSNKFGVYAEETFLPFRAPHSKLMKRQTKRNDHGETLVRTVDKHSEQFIFAVLQCFLYDANDPFRVFRFINGRL